MYVKGNSWDRALLLLAVGQGQGILERYWDVGLEIRITIDN